MPYNHKEIEKKWQKYWEENKTFKTPNPGDKDFDETKPKYYVLDMFPYPSWAWLHVGHPEGYTANDIIARYYHAKGYNVLHPMGWDAFGLPAENYAIKTWTHPEITTKKNIDNFRKQIKSLWFSYDWDREISTTDPKYYKWTQWIFLKMFENGLAYEQDLPINYCPSCKTGLANEEVLKDWTCERCGTKVIKKPIRQWVLAITKYADRLAKDVDKLDWPEGIKEMQKNWIWRSEGTEFKMYVWKSNEDENWTYSNFFLTEQEYSKLKDKLLSDERVKFIVEKEIDWEKKYEWLVELSWTQDEKEFLKNKEIFEKEYGISLMSPANVKSLSYTLYGNPKIKEKRRILKDILPKIQVYTTRIDTVFGMSYAVVAPDHKEVEKFIQSEQKQVCEKYIEEAKNKSDLDRTADNKEKTWVFTGSYVINPYNQEKVPLWIADYVLWHYGTGAVMAVPAHDERDYAFAKKYNLPIKQVIAPKDGSDVELPFTEYWILINSWDFSGLTSEQAKEELTKYAQEKGFWQKKVNYKLRDWIFSRQRYWWEPIPLIHISEEDFEKLPKISSLQDVKDKNKVYVLVRKPKENEKKWPLALTKDGKIQELVVNWKVFSKVYQGLYDKIVVDWNLPLTLPEVEKYEPAGDWQWPLARIEDWVNVKLWDNLIWKRETNTMPQWAWSCWYYLRFMDPHNDDYLVAPEVEKYRRQVDSYVGWAEHAVLHLLYARFWHKFLYDIGVVSEDEPFKRLRNQGLILAYAFQRKNGWLVPTDMVEEKDGKYYHKETGEELEKVIAKMSKSLKNVVNPDDIIEEYGADSLRLYEMYMADFKDSAPWDPKWIVWVRRFLDKVARYFIDQEPRIAKDDQEAMRLLHKTIKKVSEDIENYKFNTAIAALMILLNYWIPKEEKLAKIWKETFIKLLHPFAPHLAEEIWYLRSEELGLRSEEGEEVWRDKKCDKIDNNYKSIFFEKWPEYDESLAKDDMVTIAIQVMWKLRWNLEVPADASKDEVLQKAKEAPSVKKWLEGKQIVKEIYVPGKIVNFVVK